MHRIDHATRALNLFGPGKDGFTGGDPITQVPATTVTPEWLSEQQEELANVVELVASLQKGQTNQLANVLSLLFDAMAIGNVKAITGLSTAVRDIATDDTGMLAVAASTVALNNGLSWSFKGCAEFQNAPSIAAPYVDMYAVAHGPTGFVAVGNTGCIRTSNRLGSTWQRPPPDDDFVGWFTSVHYAEAFGLWIIGGSSGMVQTSPDGLVWTTRPLPGAPSATVVNITSNDERVVLAVGTKLYRSPDGMNYFEITLDPAPTLAIVRVEAVPTGFLAVLTDSLPLDEDLNATGRWAWRSSDGVTWARIGILIGGPWSNIRINSKTGAVLGATTHPVDALAMSLPSGSNYSPRKPLLYTSDLASSLLLRAKARWFALTPAGQFVSSPVLY